MNLFQQSIDIVQGHLSIINVPINNEKTQLIIIQRNTSDTNKKKQNDSMNDDTMDLHQKPNDIIATSNYYLNGDKIKKRSWIKLLRIRVDI